MSPTGVALQGSYNFTFRLYAAPTGGAALWNETQNGVATDTDGFYSVLLGSATALTLDFDTGYYLSLAVNGGAEMTPRQYLGMVPLAWRATVADTATYLTSGAQARGTLQVASTLTLGSAALADTSAALMFNDSLTDGIFMGLGPYRQIGVFDGGTMFLGYNFGYDATANTYKYTSANAAAGLELPLTGNIRLLTAPTGVVGNAFTPTLRMVVTNSGNVGINTAAPVDSLTVAGTVRISDSLAVDGTTLYVDAVNNRVGVDTATPAAKFAVNGLIYGLEVTAPSLKVDPNLYLYINAGLGPLLNFDDNDFLRFNRTDNYYQFATGGVGVGYFENSIHPYSNNTHGLGDATHMWTQIYVTGGAFNGSDRRLKKEIADSDLGLQFIMGLHPVRFRWNKPENGTGINYGFIAQEVEPLLGNDQAIVQAPTPGSDGNYLMQYTQFIAPLVKAVQEQQAQISALQAQNAALAARVAALEQR